MRVKFGDVATERREIFKGDKSGYPVVGLEHLVPENVNLSMWNESGVNTFTKMFHKGDVLFGRRRAYLKKAVIAPFDGICSGDITVIVAKPEHILPELLPFVVQNDAFFDYAVGKSAGSLSPRVKWEYLREYEFDLPPVDQQRKLARVLWAVNDTVEAYRRLMLATDELVRGRFVEMFGNPKKADENANTLRGSEIFTLASGKPNVTSELSEEYEYNCYGGNGITGHSKKYLVKEPTIAIGRVGQYCGCVHATTPYSWITDNAIYITSHDKERINLEFLYVEMQLLDFNRFALKVGQPKITQKPILESLYIVPSLAEQEKFVAFSRQADKSKSALNTALAAARNISRKIISDNLR